MNPTKRRAEQVQGASWLDQKYAKRRKAPSPGLTPKGLAEYRGKVLSEAEKRLAAIAVEIEAYSPNLVKRRRELARIIKQVSKEVLEINTLLCTLAEVEGKP